MNKRQSSARRAKLGAPEEEILRSDVRAARGFDFSHFPMPRLHVVDSGSSRGYALRASAPHIFPLQLRCSPMGACHSRTLAMAKGRPKNYIFTQTDRDKTPILYKRD